MKHELVLLGVNIGKALCLVPFMSEARCYLVIVGYSLTPTTFSVERVCSRTFHLPAIKFANLN